MASFRLSRFGTKNVGTRFALQRLPVLLPPVLTGDQEVNFAGLEVLGFLARRVFCQCSTIGTDNSLAASDVWTHTSIGSILQLGGNWTWQSPASNSS